MKQPQSLSDLEDFARQCINSENHPEDIHDYNQFSCRECKSDGLRLTIEHHTGSEEWNFRGVIWGECSSCGYLGRLFTFTGDSRQKSREEHPVCECGGREFNVGVCERIEGEQGIPGFFDEGVIVGKCLQCNRNRAFVYTD